MQLAWRPNEAATKMATNLWVGTVWHGTVRCHSWYEYHLCCCEGVAVIRQREEAVDEFGVLPISVRHLGHDWPSQRAVRAGQIQVHFYLRHILIEVHGIVQHHQKHSANRDYSLSTTCCSRRKNERESGRVTHHWLHFRRLHLFWCRIPWRRRNGTTDDGKHTAHEASGLPHYRSSSTSYILIDRYITRAQSYRHGAGCGRKLTAV